jgi:hypothetical protein
MRHESSPLPPPLPPENPPLPPPENPRVSADAQNLAMWPNPPHRLHRISFIGGARESGNAQSLAQWPKFPHLLHLSLEDGPLAYPPPPPSLSYPAAPPRLLSGQSRALFYRKNHTKYTVEKGEKSWGEKKKYIKVSYRNTRSRVVSKSRSLLLVRAALIKKPSSKLMTKNAAES